MMIPLVLLSLLNVYTGVLPNFILEFINKVNVELGYDALVIGEYTITGFNGQLHPALISGVFGVVVAIAFIIFIILPKSRKVGLMDTYTAGEFIYTEELLHYSADFYAPLERMYSKYPSLLRLYYMLVEKITELGRFVKYWFFSFKPEVTIFWLVAILSLLLWGDL